MITGPFTPDPFPGDPGDDDDDGGDD